VSDAGFRVVGRLTSVYGIKGWLKLHPYTEQPEDILRYVPWQVKRADCWQKLRVESSRCHGKGLVVKLAGVDDPESARGYCALDIAVASESMPELEAGEYYWSQLEALQVFTLDGILLGRVSHLIETGANDVLAVESTAASIDNKKRLLPYLPDRVIKEIDLQAGTIKVDWNPEF